MVPWIGSIQYSVSVLRFFDWLLGVMLPACRTWFGAERWFRPQRALPLGIRRMPRLETMHFDLLAAFEKTNRYRPASKLVGPILPHELLVKRLPI